MLGRALESVLFQSRQPSEVIVSDDAADGATAKMVASFGARAKFSVRYVSYPHGGSQAQNINYALEAAASDLIVLLHDDDLLYPEALEALLKPFLEVKQLVASFGYQARITDAGEDLESQSANRAFFRVEQEAGLKTNSLRSAVLGQFPNDGFMVRAGVAKAVLYEPSYGGACDTVFGVRCAGYGPFYFVPVWTSKYRLSTHSVGRGAGRKTDDSGYHFVRLCLELLSCGAPCKEEIDFRLRERICSAVIQAAALGDTDSAVSWLLGPYHRGRLLSFAGIKRAVVVALVCLRRAGRRPFLEPLKQEPDESQKKRAISASGGKNQFALQDWQQSLLKMLK
jgi:glycosyltransferase involved in cell wall biosynthesis